MIPVEVKLITLSVDCMGGDHGISVTLPAVLSFIQHESHVALKLVGLEDQIYAEIRQYRGRSLDMTRLSIVHAPDIVMMNDSIETALRKKKSSSMRRAIELVKEGQADACVSAGNTSALMAISRHLLKTLPGIDRPAICAMLPNQTQGPTTMLDLGANVDCQPHHLHQFALIGAAFVTAMEGIEKPTVGLLNVGSEEIKGNALIKQTAQLLREDHQEGKLNFYGFIEGHDIFKGTTDVVVCDGFVGNITLKAVEGLGHFVKTTLAMECRHGFFNKIGALMAHDALATSSQRLNPSRYNGASLLGLQGLVFKSHGAARCYAYEWVLKRATHAVKHHLLSRLKSIFVSPL